MTQPSETQMNDEVVELLRECREYLMSWSICKEGNRCKDIVNRIDALLAQSKAAPQVEPAGPPYVSPALDGEVRTPASAAPDSGMPEEPAAMRWWRQGATLNQSGICDIGEYANSLRSYALSLREREMENKQLLPDDCAWSCDKERRGEPCCDKWCGGGVDPDGHLRCVIVPKYGIYIHNYLTDS